MLIRLIDSWEALPRATSSFLQERLWFDLKATYSPDSHAEMAKDVAAFANALGGAIIVGATEGFAGPEYSRPLPIEHAAKIEDAFDKAVRDFCRPSPTVHVRTIPAPTHSSEVILAVNIEPFVDQPVAARHKTERDTWRFPQRVGRHTEYLMPEQLPLYMNSKARRIKLLLLRVLSQGGQVALYSVPSGSSKHATIQGPGQFLVDAVDKDGGSAATFIDQTGDLGQQTVTVPIDDIEAVWLQNDGRWGVRLAGRLEVFFGSTGASSRELAYLPPTSFVVSPLGRVVEELSKRVEGITRALSGTLDVRYRPAVEPTETAIAECAHRLWAVRTAHNAPGSPESDWFHARQELLSRLRRA